MTHERLSQAGHRLNKLMVAHERRFRKGVRYMKQLIERANLVTLFSFARKVFNMR